MTTQMGPFTKAFSPIQDESEIAKMMLDLLGLGFALVAAPIWNVGKFLPIRLTQMVPSESAYQLLPSH